MTISKSQSSKSCQLKHHQIRIIPLEPILKVLHNSNIGCVYFTCPLAFCSFQKMPRWVYGWVSLLKLREINLTTQEHWIFVWNKQEILTIGLWVLSIYGDFYSTQHTSEDACSKYSGSPKKLMSGLTTAPHLLHLGTLSAKSSSEEERIQ